MAPHRRSRLLASLLFGFALSAPAPASAADPDDAWGEITPETTNAPYEAYPVGIDSTQAGPAVLRVQILLNRALFSPGMLDGRWGNNTFQAVYHFQRQQKLPATGQVDQATYQRLFQRAGTPASVVVRRVLINDDVRGPFVQIPDDIQEHAKLPCSCYQGIEERLSERYHTTPEVLRLLNPDRDLDRVVAGDSLWLPLVRSNSDFKDLRAHSLVVSGSGNYVHAFDAQGALIMHFASVLGSSMDPTPEGDATVRNVAYNPWWDFQPAILKMVEDSVKPARIPPGPNSSVGTVWIATSIKHIGIHGTSRPEWVGYAESSGCVRLTNWDILFLAPRLAPNAAIRFIDTRNENRHLAQRPGPRPRLLGTRADDLVQSLEPTLQLAGLRREPPLRIAPVHLPERPVHRTPMRERSWWRIF